MISDDPFSMNHAIIVNSFYHLSLYLYKDIHTQAHTHALSVSYTQKPKSTVLASFWGRKMHMNDFRGYPKMLRDI